MTTHTIMLFSGSEIVGEWEATEIIVSKESYCAFMVGEKFIRISGTFIIE